MSGTSIIAQIFVSLTRFASWDIFHEFLSSAAAADLFQNQLFRNTIRVSNSLDPDQARHFVGPDLGPNCLQRLLADDTRR